MNTKYQKRTAGLSALFSLAAVNLHAIAGIGDVVIVAANPAQEMLWFAEELPQWTQAISKAQEQISKTKEIVDLVGHPERIAGDIMSLATAPLALTNDANSLATRKSVLDFTRASWTLYESGHALQEDALNVSKTYKVLGKDINRNRDRYLKMAGEKALRVRVEEATDNKQKVDKAELAVQQSTLDRLSMASTQTEIELHQAALAASRQRMELAEARVKQAESQLQAYVGKFEVDSKAEEESAKEWAESIHSAFVTQAKNAISASVDPANALPGLPR